jgi:hypothetical protein
MRVCGQDITIRGRLIRIASLSADTYEFVDNPEDTIETLEKCPERVDLFTFIQRLSDTLPKYSYPIEWDNLAVLSISTYDDWWNKQIGFKARNKAKQAEKRGVTIREVPFSDDLVRGIWEIYNECEIRQGRRFAHYGKDLETVYKMSATFLDRSTFIGAYLDDHLIGFAKLHCDTTRTQAGLAHILSLIEHRDKAPTNALVARAVRYCAENGIPNLVYSRFSDGNKQWDSLMDFKERNGFKRIELPRYYVPITYLGELSFKCGLHKRFIDRIPSPVFAALRNARNLLYSIKLHSSKGAQG